MTSSAEFELLVPPINTPSRYFFKPSFERKQNELREKTLKKRKTLKMKNPTERAMLSVNQRREFLTLDKSGNSENCTAFTYRVF